MGNPDVEIKPASRSDLGKLRSWGFFIPPSFKHHLILIAYLRGEPVGSAYLNLHTGNIDFGVTWLRSFRG